MTLYYLGTPYTNYPHGRYVAVEHAAKIAAHLIRQGKSVFCPIAHSGPLVEHGGLAARDGEMWKVINAPLMQRCDALLVGMLSGWNESDGLAHEIAWFRTARKPIQYIENTEEILLRAGLGIL
jgi:hypothetical protein